MKRFYLIIVMIFSIAAAGFAQIYKANAEASFYADKFHGRKTANGEIFNMYDYTAAHKTLPFNTILKVTNIANGKSVTVRVNDRGPFVEGREIDLSKAAAQKLDMINDGTAQVSIEILQLGSGAKVAAAPAMVKTTPAPLAEKEAPATTTTPSVTEEVAVLIEEPVEDLRWDIQTGSFSEKANAEAQAQKLLRAGFKNVVYQKSGGITRVVIRDNPTADVQAILDRLEAKGFKDYLVKQRK